MRATYFGAGIAARAARACLLLAVAACVLSTLRIFPGGVAEPAGAGPPAPKRAATLVVAVPADPVRLDPHDASDSPSTMVNFHIYDRLVELGDDMEPVPSLAVSWSSNEAGDVWRLRLRPGVRFHDGSVLSADVVKRNFDRLLDPALGLARRGIVSGFVKEVAVVDDLTVEIRLLSPVAPFLKILAHDALGIVAPAAMDAAGGAFRPIGTGPFRLASWSPGARLVLEAFEGHWRGKPPFDRIEFLIVPAGSSRAIMLETGQADAAFPVEPAHAAKLARNPEVDVEQVKTQRIVYLAFNLARRPWDDSRVRRAVSQAIDREKLARFLLFGFASPAFLPLAEGTWGYAGVPALPYDPAASRSALRALVGPGERRKVALWSPSGRYPQERAVAQGIAAALSEAGLEVEIRLFEWGAYLDLLRRKEGWDLAVLGWTPATGDADMALRPLFLSGAPGNHGGYASAEVDRLIERAVRTLDPAARRTVYEELLALLAFEMPVLPLYSPHVAYGRRSEVQGIKLSSTETVDFRFAWREGVGL